MDIPAMAIRINNGMPPEVCSRARKARAAPYAVSFCFRFRHRPAPLLEVGAAADRALFRLPRMQLTAPQIGYREKSAQNCSYPQTRIRLRTDEDWRRHWYSSRMIIPCPCFRVLLPQISNLMCRHSLQERTVLFTLSKIAHSLREFLIASPWAALLLTYRCPECRNSWSFMNLCTI